MRQILIDTNVYAAFKRNCHLTIDIFRSVEFIGLNVVVLGEILSGFKGGNKEEQNKKELNQFLNSPRVNIIQIDEETAEFYSQIYWDLKKGGTPIPSNDMWVAASAMKHGIALFTFDKHFKCIKGLILKEDTF